MLPQGRKLPRAAFPNFSSKKTIWDGIVLRFQCVTKTTLNEKVLCTVVVSKKKYPTVVSRNLFKRRVFAVLEKNLTQLDMLRFGKIVIHPKLMVQDITTKQIVKDIEDFLRSHQ